MLNADNVYFMVRGMGSQYRRIYMFFRYRRCRDTLKIKFDFRNRPVNISQVLINISLTTFPFQVIHSCFLRLFTMRQRKRIVWETDLIGTNINNSIAFIPSLRSSCMVWRSYKYYTYTQLKHTQGVIQSFCNPRAGSRLWQTGPLSRAAIFRDRGLCVNIRKNTARREHTFAA